MNSDDNLRRAWEFVERTGVSIFLTGKAGTGKTTFLRDVMANSSKTAIVVAPTGVAAINAAGVTIHSFFQLSPAPFIPGTVKQEKGFNFAKSKLRVIRSLDLLIIDEISMVRADLLDAVDDALRKYRRDSRPFGGVQLLMIGDLQQLAPVVTPSDEMLLRQHYSTPYFFGSHALSRIPYVTIRLEKVFRQQNEQFISLLNHVRDNCLTPADRQLLHSRLNPAFIPARGDGYIRLTTHNASADSYNDSRLRSLPSPVVRYQATVKGTFPELAYPTAETLEIKKGCQVMFVKNDTVAHEYYNGLIGTVESTTPDAVYVRIPGKEQPIEVTPQLWENSRYKVNELTNTVETEVQGTFSQIPLRLAWAITIHKSQGLTFDKVIIDAGASFAPGQVYVALSRCRTLEGIVLATPLSESSLTPDPAVAEYISGQQEAADRSIAALENIKSDYYRQLLTDLFTFRDVLLRHESLSRFVATNYRVSYPQENAALQRIADEMRSQVTDVSDKWIRLLATSTVKSLHDPELLDRVRKGAVYFYNTIIHIYGDILDRCARIKTENKRANQRVTELTSDLRQALLAHLYLLSNINDNGFTTSNYLIYKQQAWIRATQDPAEVTKARKKEEARIKKEQREKRRREAVSATSSAAATTAVREEKPKKEPTLEITYRLFRQGLSRDDIASERGLSVSTISNHLVRLVEQGRLTLEEVVPPVAISAITSLFERLGPDADYSRLLEAIPGIDLNDIRMVHFNLFGSLKKNS